MAAKLTTLSLAVLSKRILSPQNLHLVKSSVPTRSMTYTETGAVLERPEVVKLGITRVMAVVLPFVTFGGIISREFAALLEEHEIFAPDDDDD